MTTIQDVAKRAGVAPMTVSRVINNSGYVARPMRERVETAVADLEYVPNGLARSLRSRRTHTLALVLTDVTNPFFTTMARGVEDAANAAGYMVILGNTDEGEDKEQEYIRMLLQRQADGILLVPAVNAEKALRSIRHQKTPVVILDRAIKGAQVDVVRCDIDGGGHQLGRLLVALGHRSFAIITGPYGLPTTDERTGGFRRALADAGLEENVIVRHGEIATVYYGDQTQKSGYAMTREVMAATPRPTAIFATNNLHGIGALNALHDMGLHVPEDVALVALDDIKPMFAMFPFLTVADQSPYEMGHKAVELLLHRLNGNPPPPYQEILLESTLIIRKSSGDFRS